MKEEQRVLKKIASSVPFVWSVILKSLITGHVKSKATIFLLKFIADHQLQNVRTRTSCTTLLAAAI